MPEQIGTPTIHFPEGSVGTRMLNLFVAKVWGRGMGRLMEIMHVIWGKATPD